MPLGKCALEREVGDGPLVHFDDFVLVFSNYFDFQPLAANYPGVPSVSGRQRSFSRKHVSAPVALHGFGFFVELQPRTSFLPIFAKRKLPLLFGRRLGHDKRLASWRERAKKVPEKMLRN